MGKKAAIKPVETDLSDDFIIPKELTDGETWMNDGVRVKDHTRSTKEILNETLQQLGLSDKGIEWFDVGGTYILAKPIVKVQK